MGLLKAGGDSVDEYKVGWNLAYVHHLQREEGSHTLVIADHNGAFQPNPQERVRFTQAGAVLKEDSLTQVQTHARVRSASLELASADYRTLGLRAQSQSGQGVPEGLHHLSVADAPGQYAYEDSAQGERLLKRQIEALDRMRPVGHPRASYSSPAPLQTYQLDIHKCPAGEKRKPRPDIPSGRGFSFDVVAISAAPAGSRRPVE